MKATKRQPEIPGTERPAIPEIDASALAYVAARDERMAKTKVEVEKKHALMAVLHEHHASLEQHEDGSLTYVAHDGETKYTCMLGSAEKLKVKREAEYDPAEVEEVG